MNLYFPTEWALLQVPTFSDFLSAFSDLIAPLDERNLHKRASYCHGLSVVDHFAYSYVVGVAEVNAGLPTGSPAWVYTHERNPYTLRGAK